MLIDLDGDDDAQLTNAQRLLARTRTLRAAAAAFAAASTTLSFGSQHARPSQSAIAYRSDL